MTLKLVSGFVVVLLAAVLVSGCTDVPTIADVDAARQANELDCHPMSFGNGTYYFPCTQAHFVKALSVFVGEHPETNVTAMCGDASGGYGSDVGYFVTTQMSEV